ncbi:hypothetical protein JTB14_019780 [Gonioctena quinquepunctata]|nr:hypothetical protein JTB14_019780 [Gonioctena quinquepunctata]
MAVNFLSSVPKLKGRENYSDWSFAVQNMLVLDDLKTCLDGSETSKTKDEKAKAKIILTIDPSLFVHLTVDSIKTKLLDMEPAGNTGNAFVSATRHQGKRHSGNTAGSSNVLGSSESGNVKESNLKNVKCFRCKQMGHYKNRCPNTNKNTGNKSSNAFSAVFLSTQFSKDDWYVDFGASGHLTVNSDWLTNVSENLELQDIITANNQRLSVSCVGDINIVTVVNRNSHDITITNAMCVPGLTTNLLSVGKLIDNGNKVNFEENCC